MLRTCGVKAVHLDIYGQYWADLQNVQITTVWYLGVDSENAYLLPS